MLIGWFPLNNNFNNQGIENWTITSSGITYDTGKVTNKCALFDADTDYIKVGELNQLNSLEQYSFSCWVYINALSTYDSHASAFLSSGNWNTSGGHFVFGVYNYNNGFRRILVPNTVSCYTGINLAQEDAIQLNTWYNITITFDGELTKGYINGKYVGSRAGCKIPSTNVSYFYIGAATYYNGFTIKGKLNDVRIYDHVLSPTEIKKLAQGLACHFTFNFEDFYTPVDYLEGTGSQRIKLDITPTSKYKIEEVFSMTNTSRTSCLWCARGNSTTANSTTAFYIDSTGVRCDYGISATQTNIGSLAVDIIHTLKMDAEKWYLDGTLKTSMAVASFTAGNKIELFASYVNGQDAGLDNYSTIKLYSFKVWDENRALVGDFMPCVRNTDNKPGLYDWVTNTFYSNANSGIDFKAPYYAPVEYIESDTTNHQYINTNWYNRNNNYRVEMTALLTGLGTYCLFGNKTGSVYNYIQYNSNEGAHYLRTGFGSTWLYCASDVFQSNTIYTIVSSRDSSGRMTFDINEGKEAGASLYAGETTGAATSANSLPMFLFATNYSSNADGSGAAANYFTPMRLYKCKIYDSGVLVRDYIPVVNLLTNEAGLYDNVENKFYPNLGSGSFSAPSIANTHMVDCSGYLIDGVGSNITESKDTVWGNSCAVFNGSDSYIQINQPTFLTSTITINVWAYKEDWTTNTSERIISCTESGGWQISLDSQSGNQRDYVRLCFYAGGNYRWVYVKRNTLSSGWHMFTGVYDGTKVYLYIDGVFANSTDASGSITYGNTRLCFGAEPGGNTSLDGSYFNGKIADAEIYATALSASDILALYQGRAELDNRLNLYSGNFIEEDRIYELTKENVLFAEEFNEEPGNFKWEDKDSYHELEYIESTGTQYINTGVTPTTDTKIDIDFTYLGSSYSAWSPIYGERGSSSSTYFNLFINTTSKQISPNYAGFDPGSSSTIYFTPGARYRVMTDKGQFYLNDELVSSLSTSNTLITSTVNMYLFALGTTSGVDSRGMRARIYSCRFYEGNTLIRNFIPVRWDTTGEVGLYDTVEKKFYTNDGADEFIAGENRYQQLEYIQSTGTQYIDTGYYHHTAKTNYKWGMMLKGLPASSVVYHSPFGARTSHDSNDAYYMGINHTDMHCYGCIGGYKQDPFNPNLILSNDVYYEGKMDYTSGLYINGNYYSMPGREGRLSSFSCYIFAGNWNGTADEFFWGRIYYLKIYDIDTLVRNFIPVRDKKTGKVGLFDKVSSTFYANQGGGDFIAGPEVRYEELEYIESSGTQYIDTGYPATSTCKYELKISKQIESGGTMGSDDHWGGFLMYNSIRDGYRFHLPDSLYDVNGISDSILNITCSSDGLTINGQAGTKTNDNNSYSGNIKIWPKYSGGYNRGKCKLYSCKIYNNNVLVRDFIPVKNSETGEVGLFDKVESTFYTNQGTGNFITGPVVNNLEINRGRWIVGQLVED